MSIIVLSEDFSFALPKAISGKNVNVILNIRCYCEALGLEEEPENVENAAQSPLKPSKQLGLHESEASLNANKYDEFVTLFTIF